MITGEIKSQIDSIWNSFWSGGISNPLEVIEQITYLLFIRRLDELHTLEENKANRVKQPMGRHISCDQRPNSDRWTAVEQDSARNYLLQVSTKISFIFLITVEIWNSSVRTFQELMDR